MTSTPPTPARPDPLSVRLAPLSNAAFRSYVVQAMEFQMATLDELLADVVKIGDDVAASKRASDEAVTLLQGLGTLTPAQQAIVDQATTALTASSVTLEASAAALAAVEPPVIPPATPPANPINPATGLPFVAGEIDPGTGVTWVPPVVVAPPVVEPTPPVVEPNPINPTTGLPFVAGDIDPSTGAMWEPATAAGV